MKNKDTYEVKKSMITLHTGYQPSTCEGLDAKSIAWVETRLGVLVVGSYIVDKYKELQSLKDMTIATHPPVSTPHTVLSKCWIHDPHLEIDDGLEYARVIYELNRERYESMGIKVLEKEDIFDTSFYDEITNKNELK